MIEIQDLQNLTKEAIIDLLLEEGSQSIEVYVPKSTQLFSSTKENIAIDYAYLAFAGQKLFEASADFLYEKVPVTTHESVEFSITYADITKLADTLLLISYGYGNAPDDEEFSYNEFVEEFISDVESDTITPACEYFFDIYTEYINDSGEEEED